MTELLSDITDGTGDQISTMAYQGQKVNNGHCLHDWPEQSRPDHNHWKTWRKALRDSFPRTSTQRLGPLAQSLGPWIDGQRDKWRWFFSHATMSLYCRTYQNPSWKVYKSLQLYGEITKMNLFRFHNETNNLPLDAMRATIVQDYNNHNRVKITGWAPEHYVETPTREQQDESRKEWMITNTYN